MDLKTIVLKMLTQTNGLSTPELQFVLEEYAREQTGKDLPPDTLHLLRATGSMNSLLFTVAEYYEKKFNFTTIYELSTGRTIRVYE